MRLLLAVGLAAFAWPAVVMPAAELTPGEILHRALDVREGLKDYSATLTLHAELPRAEVQDRRAKVYYKHPNKIHVEADQFVMIPRDALLFGNLAKYIERDAELVLAGRKVALGRPIYALKVIRKGGDLEEPRLLLWVDGSNWTIVRSEVRRRGNLVMAARWRYVKVGDKFWMPQRIECNFRRGPRGGEGGKITVTFSDYQVNTGLPDSMFTQPKEPERPRRRWRHPGPGGER